MRSPFIFIPLVAFLLAACASVPEEEADASGDEEDPKNLTCTEDRELGSPRDPAKVCRGY